MNNIVAGDDLPLFIDTILLEPGKDFSPLAEGMRDYQVTAMLLWSRGIGHHGSHSFTMTESVYTFLRHQLAGLEALIGRREGCTQGSTIVCSLSYLRVAAAGEEASTRIKFSFPDRNDN
ncbi:hypothetical protein MLD38_015732 [Melastoma candidum]|uniref:Uncharacterized protein n=1 Tax=Melastoma candidum TaxID=119954 RepID=A0ACB9RGZ1_9MYRT|nr:hypothetical protein MLD38_015732 [Melastoma candidum]